MTRARDIADQQDNLGGAVAPYVAGKNFLINGNFDFFQRSSYSSTTAGYSLDRWYASVSGSASATTVTQQTTGVPVGSHYCMRIAMGSGSGYGNMYQFIETKNVSALWGKTVTVSIKLRRSSSFTRDLTLVAQISATVDAPIGATWTTISSTTASNANLPTGTTSSDWYTVSSTFTVPNNGTANSLAIFISMSNVDTSSYYEMSQAQLEIGAQMTPFTRSGGSIGGELALCQRYYVRYTCEAGAPYAVFAPSGFVETSTNAICYTTLPVTLRSYPVSVEYGGSLTIIGTSGSFAVTGIALQDRTNNKVVAITYVSSGMTAPSAAAVRANNSSTAYLGINAEL